MKPQKMDKSTIQATVKAAIDAAIGFVEGEVADDRIKAQKYFNGLSTVEAEDDRSKVVATKCRDVVRMIEPVLMRIFLQTGKPVEFVPTGPDDIHKAEQATEYVNWRFNENNGFKHLSGVFRDALVKKNGVIKAYWDESQDVDFEDYDNLTPEAMGLLEQEAEVIESEQTENGLFSAKVQRVTKDGRLKLSAIAPEDFFVDASATCVEDAFIVGDRTEMRVGDVVAMGYDFEDVSEHAGNAESALSDEEDFGRTGYSDEYDAESVNDPSMRLVQVTEAYMRMDIEGTGVPRLYQFICVGTGNHILDTTLADEMPYAVFEVDPEPHAFFGRSVVDIVKDDQDASTSLLRGLIDNMHMSNNTRYAYDESRVDDDDMMNNEMGGLVRVKGTPGDAIMPLGVTNSATAILPAIQYYDGIVDDKTGVSKAALGMDANALQSTTAAGVNAAVQAASAAVELMARHLAEGGMRRLFKIMLKLTQKHAGPDEHMRLSNNFVPVDPRSWNASMDLHANVGLGTGALDQKTAALMQVAQDQQAIMQTYGPGNPFVSFTQMFNVRADMLELANVHSVTRYYNPITPEAEQQFIAQQQQAAQGQQQGDPNAAFLQVEQMKAQQRAQSDMAEIQRKAQEAMMKDDRERDKMEQDAILKAAEMFAKYGAQPDPNITAPMRQMQAMPRG